MNYRVNTEDTTSEIHYGVQLYNQQMTHGYRKFDRLRCMNIVGMVSIAHQSGETQTHNPCPLCHWNWALSIQTNNLMKNPP